MWLRFTAAEQRDADKRLVDLGQRTAQERIAALIVHVMLRCDERGELLDDEFPFPLSQQQIADFTGLTPVHTCRVLSSLRKNAICDVGHGFVKVMERRDCSGWHAQLAGHARRSRRVAAARQPPRQLDDDKSRSGERDDDDGARRPGTERGDERRNFLRRQISQIAVVRVKPQSNGTTIAR